MKFNWFPIYQQQTDRIWDKKHNTIYISTSNNEILRHPSNKIWTVWDLREENYITLMNKIKELTIINREKWDVQG